MSRLFVILALAAFCSVGAAQDFEPAFNRVEAPSVARRDRPIKINHPSGAKVQAIFANVKDGSVEWSYLPDEHFERTATFTILVAPPGDYLLTTGDSTILKVVDESRPRPEPPPPSPGPQPKPNPPPGPGPSPAPDPKPSPKMEINWAVWIYEQADATSQIKQTNTRLSKETRQYLSSQGIGMAAYDADQEAAKAAPFKDVVGSLPALILMQDPQVFSVHPAPESLEVLKKIVSEVIGE